MEWIRIGNRVVDASAIVEAIDEADVELETGNQRVVSIILTNGTKLAFTGDEAERVWKKLTDGIEVWTETHKPPKHRMGFR